MTRRAELSFATLARLQALATLDRQRLVAEARTETDRSTARIETLAGERDAALAAYDLTHAGPRACLSSMTVAAAVLTDSDAALEKGQAMLATARAAEDQAASDWMLARHRTEWFETGAQDERARRSARRSDRIEAELRALDSLRERGR